MPAFITGARMNPSSGSLSLSATQAGIAKRAMTRERTKQEATFRCVQTADPIEGAS